MIAVGVLRMIVLVVIGVIVGVIGVVLVAGGDVGLAIGYLLPGGGGGCSPPLVIIP